jgi:hypothetical protein
VGALNPKSRSQARRLTPDQREKLDRLADLLRSQSEERREAFWESLPTMGKKKTKPKEGTMARVIADRIEALGLSKYAVSKSAGLSQTVLNRFLRGERDLRVASFEKLCRVLDLELVVIPGEKQ